MPVLAGVMMILYGLSYGRVAWRQQRPVPGAEAEPERLDDELLLNRHVTLGSVTEHTTQHLPAAEPGAANQPVGGRRATEP